jgi:hypothetical protein
MFKISKRKRRIKVEGEFLTSVLQLRKEVNGIEILFHVVPKNNFYLIFRNFELETGAERHVMTGTIERDFLQGLSKVFTVDEEQQSDLEKFIFNFKNLPVGDENEFSVATVAYMHLPSHCKDLLCRIFAESPVYLHSVPQEEFIDLQKLGLATSAVLDFETEAVHNSEECILATSLGLRLWRAGATGVPK